LTGFDQLEAADREKLRQLGENIKLLQKKPEEAIETRDDEDGKASRVGYELLGAVLACVGIGYLVDQQVGSLPIGTVTGLFAGFIAGVANAWRVTNGIERAVGLNKSPVAGTKNDKERD
jgi:ATP synthase protein I